MRLHVKTSLHKSDFKTYWIYQTVVGSEMGKEKKQKTERKRLLKFPFTKCGVAWEAEVGGLLKLCT